MNVLNIGIFVFLFIMNSNKLFSIIREKFIGILLAYLRKFQVYVAKINK